MNSTITKAPDGTITLKITIPKGEISKTKEKIIAQMAEGAKISGFRKGKAPKNIVEKNIDEKLLQEELLKELLPKFYIEAVEEQKIRPIMDPKIHIHGELKNGEDWEFEAQTTEAPEIILNNYKEKVKEVTAKSKIAIPGKEPSEASFDEIVKVLIDTVNVDIPKILLERETDRLLAQTLDEIKRIGLSLDQYLSSTGKNIESLRKEYEEKAGQDLKLELTLQKIAESEKITVTEKDINETIDKAKAPQERENLEKNKYVLASIIRQQKTLDFLRSL